MTKCHIKSVAWSAAYGVQGTCSLGKKGGKNRGERRKSKSGVDGLKTNRSHGGPLLFMLNKEGRTR
jgi:hypothetical protein